jgi:hypothetical protein
MIRLAGPRSFRAPFLAGLLVLLCLALAACGGGSSSGSAGAATKTSASKAKTYSPTVKTAFMRSCTASAQAKARGKISSEKIGEACNRALVCLSHRLTVRQLAQTMHKMEAGAENPGAKALSACKQQAREKLTQ